MSRAGSADIGSQVSSRRVPRFTGCVPLPLSLVLTLCMLNAGCTAPTKARIPARTYVGITRVACVGDSITAGSGLPNPGQSSWPAVLAQLLGPAYQVGNFGVSGATLLREGDLPYVSTPEYKAAQEFHPHIVVIALGTNDSKPQNWRFRAHLERDLYAIVRTFRRLPGNPTVYVCTPPPVFEDRWGIRATIIARDIAPRIREVCAREGWPLIDLHAALRGGADQFPDGIHPDAAGAASIAGAVEWAFRGH